MSRTDENYDKSCDFNEGEGCFTFFLGVIVSIIVFKVLGWL